MKFSLYGTEETVVKIFLICWGVIIGFLVNTVIFGFIAQFIEMRKDLDKLVDNID